MSEAAALFADIWPLPFVQRCENNGVLEQHCENNGVREFVLTEYDKDSIGLSSERETCQRCLLLFYAVKDMQSIPTAVSFLQFYA